MGYAFDLVKLGVAARGDTNLVKCQAVMPLGTNDPDFVEHFGEVDMVSSLGVTALPAPPDSNGDSAEGFIVRNVAGTNGIVVGARDERTADVTAQLAAGETCLHATGRGFDSRVFCKDKSVSMIVGAKAILSVKESSVSAAAGGSSFSMGEDGLTLVGPGGKAFISITDDTVHISAGKVLLGATPAIGVATGPTPANGISTSVFVQL